MTAKRCAGILFVHRQSNSALFLKRAGEPFWGFPGGHAEGEETPEQCAIRECREEIGSLPKGERAVLTRRISGYTNDGIGAVAPVDSAAVDGGSLPVAAAPIPDQVDFTCFVQFVDEEFVPKLNEEHTGYAWAPITDAPQPLHPGCEIAIARMTMDELGVARAMSMGDLTSPQVYENIHLFAMRITGTGMAYRLAFDEYAWRNPEIYLNEEFVARCNGLPVIWQHPKKKSMLDSKEFGDRIVGAIMLPYIKGDEVWGIARIYDAPAIKAMTDNQLSTSPSVVFRDPSVNTKMKTEDGDTVLIEGKPSLLDHLAICEQGVWDKGLAASGVLNDAELADVINDSNGESHTMSEKEEHKEDATKNDAGGNLDKLLAKLDAMCAKIDSFGEEKSKKDASKKDSDEDKDESEKKDSDEKPADEKKADSKKDSKKDSDDEPEELAADKSKKDSKKDAAKKDADDEDEKEEKKADAKKDSRHDAFADSLNAIAEKLAKFEKLHQPLTPADRKSFASAQARCDGVARAFGAEAPQWMAGEDLGSYRRRLAAVYKDHSPAWKPVDVETLADAAFDVAETQIYADAARAARDPQVLNDGELRMTPSTLESGHKVNEFYGKPSSWMNQFAGNRTYVTKIDDLKGQKGHA